MTQQEREIISVYQDWDKTATEFEALDHFFGISLGYLKALEMLHREGVRQDQVKIIGRDSVLYIFWLNKRDV